MLKNGALERKHTYFVATERSARSRYNARHHLLFRQASLMIYVTKALFLLSVQVLSSSSGHPPVGDDTLSQLLSGHSITDEQLVRVSMEQMKQWTNYLPVSVIETLRRRRRQIKNRHYQAMCRRRKQQRGSSSFVSFHHESHAREIVPSQIMTSLQIMRSLQRARTSVPQTIQNHESSGDTNSNV